MPRYPYRDLGTSLGRDFRNKLNANFDDIEADVKDLDTRIDNIVAQAGSDNTEIVDARYDSVNNVTHPTLKDRLDDTSDKIGILSRFPLDYTGRGTGATVTISQAFPSVTLAEVQSLNPSATLSDTADWYVLQKLINDANANGYRRLNIPPGTYILSKPLDFTQKLSNCVIEATGCYLKPSTGYSGELVKLSRGNDYSKSRNLRINGLAIDGLFRSSVGININDAHEWYLNNVKIYNCFVGVSLTDAWYGEFSGECVIQDCLTGIQTNVGTSIEVNTIDFRNTKINFSTDKRNFVPQNVGESDTDYNNRVVSIGVELKSLINGCKFDGLIIEAVDYGYLSRGVGTSGTSNSSIFEISKNYFEAIEKEAFRLVSTSGYSNINWTVNIEGCRFFNKPTATIGQGQFRIFGNEPFYLNIQENGAYRTFIDTDLPSSYISSKNDHPYIFIRGNNVPTSANALKYNEFGNTDVTPSKTNMLPTIQDELVLEHIPTIRSSGNRTANSLIFSVNTKPLTFVGKYNMPVIQGDNGKFYMITTKDGTSLSLTEVKNLNRIDRPVGSKTAKELYRMTGVADGTSYFCIDIQKTVTYKASIGKWVINYGQANERIAIGTGADFAAQPPISGAWYSPQVWNVQIDMGYNGQDTYWGYGYDWFGNNQTNIRAVGTFAQRPANPGIDGFIYYASDRGTYYQWNASSSTWSTYTPLF